MQYHHHLRKLGYIDDAKCLSRIPDPNFTHTWPDAGHGFPIIRIAAGLHLIQLVTSLAFGRCRKQLEVSERAAPELNRLNRP